MEYFGQSGELLRRKQTIITLHAELNEWRAKVEAHPGDSDAANIFLARARAQLAADGILEKVSAPLPESASKDSTDNAESISSTAIRTALPQRKRPRIVTRKLPKVFPHMEYQDNPFAGGDLAAAKGREKVADSLKPKKRGEDKKRTELKMEEKDDKDQEIGAKKIVYAARCPTSNADCSSLCCLTCQFV